jgi:NAD(P)-dependent dehydrogenase (short-subunit alcohol dehydrogenase family)
MSRFITEVDDQAPLDLVIANAGVTEETIGTRADLEASAYKVFDVNVNGVFNTIFPALPAMQKRGSGQIAIMSSLAGNGALSASAAYCGSKAAVRVWGESARMTLQRDGVCVNVVTPGYVASPMTAVNKFKVGSRCP